MRNGIIRPVALLAVAASVAIGCDGAPEPEREPGPANPSAAALAAAPANSAVDPAAEMVVYKSPTCGCCAAWIEHMEAHGFQAEVVDFGMYDRLAATKRQHGVPDDLTSCHTAVVDGYVIEGHVPADVVRRLLTERPAVRGIAVPGMPIGSPGMEGPDPEVYDVVTFDDAGNRTLYERIDPRQPRNGAR